MLEAKIEALTNKIDELIDALGQTPESASDAPEPETVTAKPNTDKPNKAPRRKARVTTEPASSEEDEEDEDEEQEEEQTRSRSSKAPDEDDVIDALVVVREQLGRQSAKDVLAQYKAKKVGDLKPGDYKRVITDCRKRVKEAA